MAKQSGIFKVEGTLDDVTFLKNENGYFIRKKGGVSRERIQRDPEFKRTRENGTEFAMVAGAGKTLRVAAGALLQRAYDPRLSTRLMALLSQVKKCDLDSARGKRLVQLGLGTPEGKQLLKGFDFNGRATLSGVLHAPYALSTATGKVTISALVPEDMLTAPEHATHVSFRSAVLVVDFAGGGGSLSMSPAVNVPIDRAESSPAMTPAAMPASPGTKMFMLLIEFYQELNGEQYLLRNGNFNVLNLLDLV